MTTLTTLTILTHLVAWLWQGVAIAVLTALTLRRMERLDAATRHSIWWLALVAVVLLPIVQTVPIQSPAQSLRGVNEPASASALIVVPAISNWVISCAIAIWLVTAIAGWMRIAAGLRRLVRLRQDSRPFDAEWETRLTMWMSVRRSGRRPGLRVADMACGACALGLGRPTIVVSQRLLNALDDEALDQIVMHEHAHLARFDDWSRLAQAIVTSVAGLHPAVWFISRQIDLEREAACDDRVVSQTGAARRYAACLADVAAISVGSFDTAVIPGALESPSTLRARVGRLLETRRHRAARPARSFCVAGVFLFTGIVIGSTAVRPVVMFLESRPAAVVDVVATAPAGRVQPPAARSDRDAYPPGTENPRTQRSNRSLRRSTPAEATVAMEQKNAVSVATSPIPQARTVEATEAPPPLEGSRLEHAFDVPVAPDRARLNEPATPVAPAMAVTQGTLSSDAPLWNQAADAGVALGGSAKRAGVALGGFFTRAGKAIAKSF